MKSESEGTEAWVQNEIRKALHRAGWRTQKIPGSQLLKGMPDLYCVHKEGRIIHIEVKARGVHKLRWSQVEWFEKFDQQDPGRSEAFYVVNDPEELGATISGCSNWRAWVPKGKRLAQVVEEWAEES